VRGVGRKAEADSNSDLDLWWAGRNPFLRRGIGQSGKVSGLLLPWRQPGPPLAVEGLSEFGFGRSSFGASPCRTEAGEENR